MILFQAFSRARRNYRKNTRSCPLYTLPNEIVERIREYLDEVDRSCLALSTSKYLEALCPKGLAIDQKSSAPLSDRIKRDHFYKSRTQWLDRKLGFLCHFIRLKNLAKARPKDKATRSMAYECKECCCVFDRSCTYRGMELAIRPERNWSTRLPPATRPLFFCRPTVFIERRTSKITIRYTAFLTAQNVRLQLTAPRLRRALQKSRLEICPHMATTDSSTIERLVDEWENASDAGNAWERIGIDCKVCSTKICITKDYMPNIYAVEVVRRLGSLKSPGDPVFRSHCYQRAEVLKETGK
ncbi:predicted protein [Pyrenophora tritici-repentis Pt-1C-BFP]|uniref:F-box domain-containing protein n=1 Tax=Pyrenophora tritici-repentis (strain Pt-1C-BFP) TaxID=426418 RepID=B2WJ99_PYRTR|nr:uncharacterized protein PTRG_10058 [Pyrenophora tritici-repentis Pt-1C-BFP]EDU43109.1 predicted protein [Pyrenophora tritici-repentis Pt-1C-BFP]